MRALHGLDPESTRPFYFSQPDIQPSESDDIPAQQGDDVQEWIAIALGIDGAARVLINFAFEQAAHHATDNKTTSWLKNSISLPSDDDLSIIIRFTPPDEDDHDEEALERTRQSQEKSLKSKIEKLDVFLKLSSSLSTTLINELENISNKSSSSDKT